MKRKNELKILLLKTFILIITLLIFNFCKNEGNEFTGKSEGILLQGKVDVSRNSQVCRKDDSPCGSCDPACHTEGLIDPGSSGTRDGLGTNPDGPGVILGTDLINAPYTWVANYNEGKVTKIRMSDGACVGIYRVGLRGDGNGDSPSRTTVDGKGNVYVANRGGGGWGNSSPYASVTKIAGDARFCVDRNHNGRIDTSTSCSDIKDLGKDECVLWTRVFDGEWGARGIVIDFGDSIHWEGYPWVGRTGPSWDTESIHYVDKLDPDTGSTISQISWRIQPYGFSIDSKGWIWATAVNYYWNGSGTGGIIAFDSNPESPTYLQKTNFFWINHSVCGYHFGYGITVDLRDRVWIGSWYSSGGKPCRFSPTYGPDGKPIDGEWWAPNTIDSGVYRGIAVDPDGYIWAVKWDSGIWRFNQDDGSNQRFISLGCGPLGVAVDPYGKIWVSKYNCNQVTKIDPLTFSITDYTAGNSGTYTYSDFTGLQRSLRSPRGTWERVFVRCSATPQDKWGQIYWDITTPSNSLVTIYGKSADTEAGLASATQVTIARIPPATPPKDLPTVFSDARVYLGKYLDIRVVMEQSTDGQSPVFVNLYTTYYCY